MSLVPITIDLVAPAADVVAHALLDEPSGRHLFPDRDEFLAVHKQTYRRTIARALDDGHVDAWGEPIVGVAVWLRRPAIDEPELRPASPSPTVPRSATADRLEEFADVLHRLRETARPDRHVYLDAVGVLSPHRRQGIATSLLAAGHRWADAAGLQCALDTFDDSNVAFYERRGYRVVATLPLHGAGLVGRAMRRSVPPMEGLRPRSVVPRAESWSGQGDPCRGSAQAAVGCQLRRP